jgi:hypothetical protein
LILERIYEEVDWRTPEPKEILDIKKNAEIYEDATNDVVEDVLEYGNDELLPSEIEAEREEERAKTMRNRRSMKDVHFGRETNKVGAKRKDRADKIEKMTRKKFVTEQAKVNK